jgi:hypothetical protein
MDTMPFGKYKGWEIRTIPVDYLIWLRREKRLWPDLAQAVNRAIGDEVVEDEDVWADWDGR